MKKGLTNLLLMSLVCGCSPESYRRSADLQVDDILRDRKQQTLGYQPQTEVSTEIPAKPSKKAYEKIPATPIAPPTTAPIQPVAGEAPANGPLGPETYWMNPTFRPLETVDMDEVRRQSELPDLGPPLPDDMIHRFGLFDCLEYAVQHSRTYQDRMEDLYLRTLDVTLARHLFDPTPFARQSLRWNGVQRDLDDTNDVHFRSAMKTVTEAGVRQRLPYGGEVVASTLVDFTEVLRGGAEDGEAANLVLSGSIPLLRGFGLVNLESLIQSERNVVYQVRTFEEFRRSFVVDIASAYFRLLEQHQGVINQRLNLISRQNLTERTRELFAAGRLSYLEVQRALQEQLQSENDLINAEESYRSAVDNFKITLGMPVNEPLQVVPVELEVNAPRVTAAQAVDLAYQYRLSLQTASDQIEDARRSVQNARNGLLPDLNLNASASTINESDAPALGLNDRDQEYSASITLDLPLDRVAERNSYRRALISLYRSQRNFTALKDSITVQVRNTLRAIYQAELSVEIQRRNIELAERRLENANEQLRMGRIGNRDVVEAQNALLAAQDRFEQARSQFQIRVLEYMRDTGTLRVDPSAGAIGRAMDRQALQATQPAEPH